MTPNNAIYGLIPQAQRFKANAEAIMNPPKRQQNFVGNLFVKAIVPHGVKGLVRDLGKGMYGDSRAKQIANIQNLTIQFILSCQERVRLISVNGKVLPPDGNSSVLVRKFNSALRMKNPAKAMERTIIVLQEISSLNLLWNAEIPQELEKRKNLRLKALEEKKKLKEAEQRIQRSSVAAEALDRNEIGARLEKYPSVRTSVLGAFDALENGGPDAERHCISSCRIALEAMCIEVGKNGDWKAAVINIFSSESDRQFIKNVHHFLSGKGSHAGHEPTRSEAEACLKHTIPTLAMIIERADNIKGNT